MTRPPYPEYIVEYSRFREPSPEDLLAWDRALAAAAEELGCPAGERFDVKVALPYGDVRTAFELQYRAAREEEE